MKKLLLFINFSCCILTNGYSQNPLVKQWDKRFGGDSTETLKSFQQTSDGGYILGGWSNSNSSGDKTQNHWGPPYSYDYWIVKTDSLGNKQWDKDFGGYENDYLLSVQQTTDGGYILGGQSLSDSSGDKTENTLGGFDYWIVKTDSLGNKQWDRDYGTGAYDYFRSMQQTLDKGYILGGYHMLGMHNDFWIVKTDSIGTMQWNKTYGGFDHDIFNSFQQTDDGGYILGGSSFSQIGGDKTQTTWNNSEDYWIIKTDYLGNKQWDKDFGGTYNDQLTSLRQTADKGYILAGTSNSDISGNKTQNSWGGFDYWIVKTDSLGNKQWDKDFGGTNSEDEFGNISQTHDGGYLMAGTTYSNLSGDKTENNLGLEQTWVVKTDSLGIKQWDKTIFTTGHDETGYGTQSKDGCFVMGISTDGGIGGYKTQPSWGWDDYWIVKFCDSTATTSITQLPDTRLPFTIYPNPAGKELRIKNAGLRIKEIVIADLFGRTVLESSIFSEGVHSDNQQSSINISSLSPGIYFIKAGNEVRKFVKE